MNEYERYAEASNPTNNQGAIPLSRTFPSFCPPLFLILSPSLLSSPLVLLLGEAAPFNQLGSLRCLCGN